VIVVTIAFTFRALGLAAALAAPLLVAPVSVAQELGTPLYSPGLPPAPIGHRQPRAADIPQSGKSQADILEERQQAELNRRLRICRNC
jgi:hypothetical protein